MLGKYNIRYSEIAYKIFCCKYILFQEINLYLKKVFYIFVPKSMSYARKDYEL